MKENDELNNQDDELDLINNDYQYYYDNDFVDNYEFKQRNDLDTVVPLKFYTDTKKQLNTLTDVFPEFVINSSRSMLDMPNTSFKNANGQFEQDWKGDRFGKATLNQINENLRLLDNGWPVPERFGTLRKQKRTALCSTLKLLI